MNNNLGAATTTEAGSGSLSFITLNWRGKPLHDYRTVFKSIGATKTQEGLEVHCELDPKTYEKGRKVPKEEMASIH